MTGRTDQSALIPSGTPPDTLKLNIWRSNNGYYYQRIHRPSGKANVRLFDDYKEGSATASYNAQCAEAAAILEKVKAKCATDEQRERAEYLYNRYCSVLAEAINRDNETQAPGARPC